VRQGRRDEADGMRQARSGGCSDVGETRQTGQGRRDKAGEAWWCGGGGRMKRKRNTSQA